MESEKLIQEFIKQFTGQQRVEVERFLRTLTENGVQFSEAIRRANSEFNSTGITVKDLSSSIDGILNSLGRQNRVVSEGTKSFRKLESIVRRIQDDQAGIYDLSLKELKTNKTKALSELSRLANITEGLIKRAAAGEELNRSELELLLVSQNQFENQKAIVDVLDKRIKKEKNLESALGLTGAVLENLNKIGVRALGGIGVNLGTLQEAFDEARESGREAALELDALENSERFNNLSKRIVTLGASLRGVGKGIFEAFDDPLTLGIGLIKQITEQVFNLNVAQNEFRRLTGQSADAFDSIFSRATTVVDVLNTAAGITEKIGLNANSIFNSSQLVNIAEAQELLGLSLDQATQIATVSKLTGQSQESFNNSILRGADASNKLFKSVVPPGVALREAAGASADIILSLGMAPGRLGKAASAAKALGLELSKLNSIADSLLDFESSIQNELEAQLLTGKQINLTRAREFALVNDLEGVAQELANNNITASEFANMNRIAQESVAKALGLSREELGQVVLQQSLASSLTDKQRASVLGINQSQLEQLDIQKSIEKSLQSITQSFAGTLEFVAKIAEQSGVIYGIIGAGFALSIGKFIIGLTSALFQWKLIKKEVNDLIPQLGTAAALSKQVTPGVSTGLLDTKGKPITSSPNVVGTVGKTAGKTIGKKLLRAIPYIGLAYAAYDILKSFVPGDDMISAPSMKSGYGDRILLDKGSVTALNNNDTLIAGTNLGGSSTGPTRTEQLLERLVKAVEKGGNVYIDGNRAGEALVLGTYKSS
jgi:hypothetical protein